MPSAVDEVLSAPWWPELVRIKDTLSYAALGERFGAPSQAIRSALLRSGLDKVAMPRGGAGSQVPRDVEPVAAPPEQRLRELAGTMPDPKVADGLGLTAEAVKAYRRAHGITPYFRPPPGAAVARPAPELTPAAPTPSTQKPGPAMPVVLRRRVNAAGTTEQVEHRPVTAAPESAPTAPFATEPPGSPRKPAAAPKGPAPGRRRAENPGSPLDAFRTLLGTVRDADVAERAGVKLSAVVSYRAKHGIAAYDGFRKRKAASASGTLDPAGAGASPSASAAFVDKQDSSVPKPTRASSAASAPDTSRAQTPAPLDYASVPKNAHPSGAPEVLAQPNVDEDRDRDAVSPGARRGRRSKLEPFAHLIGVLHDAEIATMAGVIQGSVQVYRSRNRIQASWLVKDASEPVGEAEHAVKAPAPLVVKEARAVEVLAVAAPIEARVEAIAPDAPATATSTADVNASAAMAYAITARSSGETRKFVVVGGDMVEAVERAVRSLQARAGGPWLLIRVKVIAEALG